MNKAPDFRHIGLKAISKEGAIQCESAQWFAQGQMR